MAPKLAKQTGVLPSESKKENNEETTETVSINRLSVPPTMDTIKRFYPDRWEDLTDEHISRLAWSNFSKIIKNREAKKSKKVEKKINPKKALEASGRLFTKAEMHYLKSIENEDDRESASDFEETDDDEVEADKENIPPAAGNKRARVV